MVVEYWSLVDCKAHNQLNLTFQDHITSRILRAAEKRPPTGFSVGRF